jgi:hypothetical protein
MSERAMDAPVFVVGSPRSGTTLLYHLLLSAGGFAKYHAEASVFNLLAPRFGNLSSARRRDDLLDEWMVSEYFKRSGLDAAAFRRAVHDECRSAGDFLRLLMESIARQQGVRRWAECTPDNLLYVPAIAAAFPNARFLHIVRDGRDVACSLAEQGWVKPHHQGSVLDRVVHAGLYWDWMMARGRRHFSRPGLSVLEVRFEALVVQPVPTLKTIGVFIDHDLDYTRIRANGVGTVGRPNTSFPQTQAAGFDPVGRFRSRLDRIALARLEAAIEPELVARGYALASDLADRRAETAMADRARRRARWRFSSRHFLKTRTPLGRFFTSPALLRDFRAFDRDRQIPSERKQTA